MKKFLSTMAFLMAFTSVTFAQNMFNHMSVGLNVGTTGIGIDVATPVTDYFTLRAGYNFVPKISYKTDIDICLPELSNYQQYISAPIPSEVKVKGDLDGMNTGKLLVDIYPFGGKLSFHVTAGAYFGGDKIVKVYNAQSGAFSAVTEWNNFAASAAGQALKAEPIGAELGDYLLTPDQKGNVEASIKVKKFRPYLGIGFGRTVPKTKMSFVTELGCQFWGSPTIYCNGKQLEKNKVGDGDEGGIIKAISNVTVYPVLNFRICGRII